MVIKRHIKATFPLDFEILSADRKSLLSGIQEAFTVQVSRDTIQVRFYPADADIGLRLDDPSVMLSLIIHIPKYYKPLTAYGKAREITKIEHKTAPQFRMLIDLVEMQEKDRKLLVEYAKWLNWRPRYLLLLLLVIIVLGGGAVGSSYYLMKEDYRLREEIRNAGAESELTIKKLAGLNAEKAILEIELRKLEKQLTEQMKKKALTEKQVIDIKDPRREEERKALEKKLQAAEDEKERLRQQVETLQKAKGTLVAQIAAKTEAPSETIRVTFKDGKSVTGTLIESNEDHIKLKIGCRPRILNRKLIKYMEYIPTEQ